MEVGDKANDAVRVNGNELRAKVVVEGGNLGITQRGRIEAALGGVLVNTDAIDNSAGVDCSDHEVNIKILIDNLIAAGRMDAGGRADFLHSLTDEVAELVLRTNADQNVLLMNDRYQIVQSSPGFERMMDWLEPAAGLDRGLEALPGTEELHARLAAGPASPARSSRSCAPTPKPNWPARSMPAAWPMIPGSVRPCAPTFPHGSPNGSRQSWTPIRCAARLSAPWWRTT